MDSDLFGEDHERFRVSVREFVDKHVVPKLQQWDKDRLIDRDTWRIAGKLGLLGQAAPKHFGGAEEQDYRYRVVIQQEIARVGASALQSGFSTNDDIVLNYLLRHADEGQCARWLSGFVTGETIGAIAMSEPGAGSDLRAIQTTAKKDARGWVLNGSKTFITSGILCDLVIVFAKTDPGAGSRGFSLFVVEDGTPGFCRGRKLDKVGLHAQDTAELMFDDVLLGRDNLLGDEGAGFAYLMQSLPLERLGIAIAAQASAEAVFDWTMDYVSRQRDSGERVGDLQSPGFVLAEMKTAIEVSREYLDRCVREYNLRTLTAVDAAKAKYWATELQGRVIDAGLRLHGDYGYVPEYRFAKALIDARIQRIYGGTNEIMREIIRRDLMASGRP